VLLAVSQYSSPTYEQRVARRLSRRTRELLRRYEARSATSAQHRRTRSLIRRIGKNLKPRAAQPPVQTINTSIKIDIPSAMKAPPLLDDSIERAIKQLIADAEKKISEIKPRKVAKKSKKVKRSEKSKKLVKEGKKLVKEGKKLLKEGKKSKEGKKLVKEGKKLLKEGKKIVKKEKKSVKKGGKKAQPKSSLQATFFKECKEYYVKRISVCQSTIKSISNKSVAKQAKKTIKRAKAVITDIKALEKNWQKKKLKKVVKNGKQALADIEKAKKSFVKTQKAIEKAATKVLKPKVSKPKPKAPKPKPKPPKPKAPKPKVLIPKFYDIFAPIHSRLPYRPTPRRAPPKVPQSRNSNKGRSGKRPPRQGR